MDHDILVLGVQDLQKGVGPVHFRLKFIPAFTGYQIPCGPVITGNVIRDLLPGCFINIILTDNLLFQQGIKTFKSFDDAIPGINVLDAAEGMTVTNRLVRDIIAQHLIQKHGKNICTGHALNEMMF